jgi:hypothetical protein
MLIEKKYGGNGTIREIQTFIEQEWQKQDDQGLVDEYNRNREPKDHIVDVSEIERRDGLELDDKGLIQERRWLDPR